MLDLGAGYCDFINNIKASEKYALDVMFTSNLFEHLTHVELLVTIAPIAPPGSEWLSAGKGIYSNLSQYWQKHPFIVMPAQAGIQQTFKMPDSGLRRNDNKSGRHRVF